MAKTSGFSILKQAMRMAWEAEKRSIPTTEYVELFAYQKLNRRAFLENSGKLVLGTSLLSAIPPLFNVQNSNINPRIAIIGGGIAGLNALHTFKKHGLEATLYESASRTGGRMFTVANVVGENTWTELGGEYIDSNHKDMFALAKEFQLSFLDIYQASEKELISEAYFFEDRFRSLNEVVDAFRKITPAMVKVANALPENINYKTKNPLAIQYDNLSMEAYLQSLEADKWIINLIKAAYEPEFGLDAGDQSALNLISYISTDTSDDDINLFGDSDERYKIKGGNQSIPNALTQKYSHNIELNSTLTSISQDGKAYVLRFTNKLEAVKADFVLITIPFTKLREVDIQVPLPSLKQQSINELGYGINSKFTLGFTEHFWRQNKYAGLVYSDNAIGNGWDSTQLQTSDHSTAALSILFSGTKSINLKNRTQTENKALFLKDWETIFPGVTQKHNGKVAQMIWETYPHTKGSYTCYKPGQYTTMAGVESENVENIFFAGEHCNAEFSGYMNGGAKSGREAAEKIMAKAKIISLKK